MSAAAGRVMGGRWEAAGGGDQAREHAVLNEIVRRSVAIKADVVRQVPARSLRAKERA